MIRRLARTVVLLSALACREGLVPADRSVAVGPVPSPLPAPAPVTPAPPPPERVAADSTWSADSSLVAWVVRWSTVDSTELWLGYRDGRDAVRLAASDGSFFDDLTFSLDGDRLFFLVPYWVVSPQVNWADLSTFEVHDSSVGATQLRIVPRGRYAGLLALEQGIIKGEEVRRWYWRLHTTDLEFVEEVALEGMYDTWAAQHIPPP